MMPDMADWVTISSLATAGGTLALAGATYGAVRSSNRSARVAEQALQEQRRPLIVHARLDDPMQKVRFVDGHWVHAEGADGVIEEGDGVLYLAMALRNVGNGIGVLLGWHPWPDLETTRTPHPPVEDFRLQTRDIYIAPGDVGLWQGALRDPAEPIFGEMSAASAGRQTVTIDLLYSDQVGGQRTISRFTITPVGDDRWNTSAGRHWNLDGATPR
jgi:hypothetical protein